MKRTILWISVGVFAMFLIAVAVTVYLLQRTGTCLEPRDHAVETGADRLDRAGLGHVGHGANLPGSGSPAERAVTGVTTRAHHCSGRFAGRVPVGGTAYFCSR